MEIAAQSLVGNVGQLLGDEYRLLRGVGDEVAQLRDDVATMNALLHMQSEVDEGAVDHFVREWMKQLRELAYDAEDCVNHYMLRIKCRSRGDMRTRLKHTLEMLFPRHRLAGEIRSLRARAVAISERHARYCVNSDVLRRSPVAVLAASFISGGWHAALRPDKDTAELHHQPIGIDGQVDTLARRLKAGAVDDGRRHFKVFSIVGFGGLGKTTLAMEVCRRLEPEFPCQAMVAVSQAFEPGRDVVALLKRVLHQVVKPKLENDKGVKQEETLGRIDGLDEKELVDKLKEIIKVKRYLIVIDDVWTVRAWETIQSVLPENKCDSRIIVTTRIENVANACSPASVGGHYIHHMEPLTPEYSKKLFLMKTFGAMDAHYPDELEDVMSDILKKCGGLPLAIVSLASVFAAYGYSKDKWQKICKSIGTQMESRPTLEGMKHIVTLSYNHLPYEIKGCMMYLSIFPEDYEINKDRLLCRWIAEGLIPEKRGLTLMEVAESYLDELINRNMIEVRFCFDEYWKAESCRVHDMLLEVMVSKSLECNFVSLLGGQYATISYDRIRRLSIQGGDDNSRSKSVEQPMKKTEGRGVEGMDVKHARSLSIFQHGVQKLLDQLEKFVLLSVLDLEGCEDLTDNHMRHICRLYLLRFLSLWGTGISKVPPEIRKLEHLQTLDLWKSGVIELPETVTKLGKLERLHLRNKTDWKQMWSLPRGIQNMRSLRELGMVILGNDIQVAQEVGQLEKLEDIKLFLKTEKIIGNDNVIQEIARSLSRLYSLRRLIIEDHGYYNGRYDVHGGGSSILNFLHDLSSPPRHLLCLKISGPMDCIPTWVSSLTYLVEFRLCFARLVDDQLLGVLCNLPNLKCIQLEWGCYNGTKLVARTSHNFPSLTKLRVICAAENPKVFQFEAGSMPKLETLHINFAENRDRSIVGIEHLTKLKEVQLSGAVDNTALKRALEELNADVSGRRTESGSNQFQISVQHWWP